MDRKTILARITVALLIILLMLPNVIWAVHGLGALQWDAAIVVPIALLAALFSLFGRRIWLVCLLLSPFAMLAPLESFYVAIYRHPSTPEILGTVFATNTSETFGYFGWLLVPLALSLLVGLLLALYAARVSWTQQLRWIGRAREWVLAASILLPLMVFAMSAIRENGGLKKRLIGSLSSMSAMATPIALGYPFGTIARGTEFWEEWKAMSADAFQLDSFRFHAVERHEIGKRQIYVLVLGESSRRNHWQLFGYSRSTNPELSGMQNMVPIPDMITSWPESIMAVPLVLTRKPETQAGFAWNEASILRAMQEAGYDTWWISNQLPLGRFDSPISTYAMEAKHRLFLNHTSWSSPGSPDEVLLQPFKKVLSQGDLHKDLFIVLHMMGSHLPYDLRYPSTFKQFTPTISDGTTNVAQGLRFQNSYDNTILYTDHVLAQIIKTLNESNAVSALWFESDHGETLPTPTCSLSGHGIGTRYDYMIPALFWYSNAYASQFPDRVAQFQLNAKNRTLSASTFESLIDMAGVDFPGHDSTKSLFSSKWHYHPRRVTAMWQTDFDTAQFGKGCEVVIPSKLN